MSANPDLAAAFGGDDDLATQHYIMNGFYEGRSTGTTTTPVSTSPVEQAVSEGSSDLPQSTGTSGYVGVGQSATGTISLYDRDWFRTEFTAGENVIIQARGSATGGGTLFDPVLRVYDSNGNYLSGNDDSGVGRDSYLSYTPASSGTYYLEVDGWSSYTGTYTVEVATASSAVLAAVTDDPILADDPTPLGPDKDPSSDDIQLTALGPEPTYTDWIL